MSELYWIGPVGVYIPKSINGVVALDGVNTQYQNGMTEVHVISGGYTVQEYRQKFAVYDSETGKYFWKVDYWIGPAGVYIPKSIKSVVALDGYNTHSLDGGITEIYCEDNPGFTKEEYRKRFSVYNPTNGRYYWKKN